MLRVLFGEPRRREDQGMLAEVNAALHDYEEVLNKLESNKEGPDPWLRYLQVWAKGFLRSMDELEQSIYCSHKYSQLIRKNDLGQMSPEELDQYHLFLYFYKNALVRLFSILDKVGCFLNDLLKLEADKLKSKFSYFTVLRQMHEREIAVGLEIKLYELKEKYKDPMQRLRTQRNSEIHCMNQELVDDVERLNKDDDGKAPLESIEANLADMDQGFEMICRTVTTVFTSLVNS